MTSTGQQARIFCTSCGTPADFGARLCNKCGHPVTSGERLTSAPKQPEPVGEWPYSFPRFVFEDKTVKDGKAYEKVLYDSGSVVEVRWLEFEFTDKRFRRPSPPPLKVRVLITDQRVALLDRRGRLVEDEIVLTPAGSFSRGVDNRLPVSQFWVLTSEANEGLYKEFIQNPKGFTKVRTAWWGLAYRKWSWIKAVQWSSNSDLVFTLDSVRAFSGAGPGKCVPTSQPEGRVLLVLDRSADTQNRLRQVEESWKKSGRLDKSGESRPPFSQEFVAAIPVKPETPAFKAYTNSFYIAIVEVFCVGALWAAGAPWWLILFVGIGVAWFVLYLLKRLRLWAEKHFSNRQ
jgi:hypothetical protein